MSQQEWLVVGQVVGAFGVHGWVRVRSYTDPAAGLLDYQPWRVVSSCDGVPAVRELRVTEFRETNKGILVDFGGCLSREQAQELRGARIEVHKSQLPALAVGDYYWHQLIGCRVKTLTGQDLGKVKNLLETGANDVLVVQGDHQASQSGECLIPYLPEQVVRSVDLSQSTIEVDWDPEY